MEGAKRRGKLAKTLVQAVKKDMSICGVIRLMTLNKVEWKSKTDKMNPK